MARAPRQPFTPEVHQKILTLRKAGQSNKQIADQLNAAGFQMPADPSRKRPAKPFTCQAVAADVTAETRQTDDAEELQRQIVQEQQARQKKLAVYSPEERAARLDTIRWAVPTLVSIDDETRAETYEGSAVEWSDEEWEAWKAWFLSIDTDSLMQKATEDYERRKDTPKDFSTKAGLSDVPDDDSTPSVPDSLRSGNRFAREGGWSWQDSLTRMIVKQERASNLSAMRLLDEIGDPTKDQSRVKGLLRTLWYGMMRNAALDFETIMALKKRLGEQG